MMEERTKVTKEELKFLANDIIGDLMNLRLIDTTTPDDKLDNAAMFIVKTLEYLVERAKE